MWRTYLPLVYMDCLLSYFHHLFHSIVLVRHALILLCLCIYVWLNMDEEYWNVAHKTPRHHD